MGCSRHSTGTPAAGRRDGHATTDRRNVEPISMERTDTII